ncbi:RES family NAD+ phosphorylase [Jatrophihabitans sp.]|uniref:RES family NAD+ phosphorylase n=1 Tax=Jatrophihabitans sp. TaxID=1932789 RepID=UPI002C5D68B0|nr:RES family NAD+ phosphorylase [Jatrophihabitans sp.]
MVTFYRVLPYLDTARAGEPGHPLYLSSARGSNRVDNPGHYQVLYLADAPAGALAEAFGSFSRWNRGLFRGTPSLSRSVRALVTYELDEGAAICDLDDAYTLVELGLRPSEVVTRNRAVTQSWALKLYEAGRYAGVRWWSYYDPRWGSIGLWDSRLLTVVEVAVLDDLMHPAMVEAAAVLCRILEP